MSTKNKSTKNKSTKNTHSISAMDSTGDSTHTWDPTKWDEVEIAKGVYDKYKEKGYQAFHMKDNTQGDQMDSFDCTAKTILFIPQMKGG